jgi:Family of unknown function (DUF6368)
LAYKIFEQLFFKLEGVQPMGGPGASILVHNTLTKQQEDELAIWLRSMANHLEKDKWGYQFWWNEDAFPGTVSRCLFYLSLDNPQEYWDDDEMRQVKEQLGFLPEQSISVSSGCNQKNDHTTLGQVVLHLARIYDGLIDMGGAIMPPLKPVNRKRLEDWWATSSAQDKERRAYLHTQLEVLRASLSPEKTLRDLMKEQLHNPHSALSAIIADVEAKFGPAIPPEFSYVESLPPLDEVSTYVRALPGSVYEIEYTAAAGHRCVFHIVDGAFLQSWMEHPNFYMIK